jgi:thiamine biosynthesis lipoprotein
MQAAQERHFRAMGSTVHLIVVADDREALLDRAQGRIDELEQRWSRFIATSEISELNRRASEAVRVSADTALLVERAVDAWRITGGGFDPTVLGAMLRAGYDRDFREVAAAGNHGTAGTSNLLLVGCTDIELRHDDQGTTVRLPEGSGFDPGGIGKGLAADLVATELIGAGAHGVCINMGGDLRVLGDGPDGAAWTIAVDHPWLEEPVALLGLAAGAVAPSTTLKRAWVADGRPRHHLIDPATGEPSGSDLDVVAVVAGEAWIAEVLAKAVLLRGSARAFDLVDTTQVQALSVDRDGVVRCTTGLAAYTGGAPLPDHLDLAGARPAPGSAAGDPSASAT